jgi:hypothetical protein
MFFFLFFLILNFKHCIEYYTENLLSNNINPIENFNLFFQNKIKSFNISHIFINDISKDILHKHFCDCLKSILNLFDDDIYNIHIVITYQVYYLLNKLNQELSW